MTALAASRKIGVETAQPSTVDRKDRGRSVSAPNARRGASEVCRETILGGRRPDRRADETDFNDLDWLARQLDRYWPGRRLEIFVEEFGWNTEHETSGWLYVFSRKKQAAQFKGAPRRRKASAHQHDVLVQAL